MGSGLEVIHARWGLGWLVVGAQPVVGGTGRGGKHSDNAGEDPALGGLLLLLFLGYLGGLLLEVLLRLLRILFGLLAGLLSLLGGLFLGVVQALGGVLAVVVELF